MKRSAVGVSDLDSLEVLVVHSSPLHELVVLAAEKVVCGFHIGIHYASSPEEAVRIATKQGLRIDSAFLEYGLVGELSELPESLANLAKLQHVVIICTSDDEVGAGRLAASTDSHLA